jgi:hypothetical protein
LVIKDFFIPLCESLLIDKYIPIWNKIIDGFGNESTGSAKSEGLRGTTRFIMPRPAQLGFPHD